MPHELYLYRETGGALLLSSSTHLAAVMLLNYEPKAPKRAPDGYEDVTETIELLAHNNALSYTAVGVLREIERYLALGAEYQRTGVGEPTYLRYKTATDSAVWRSEILMADVGLGDDAMKVWAQGQIVLRLTVTRRWFWEAADKVQIPLSNGNGSLTTSGLTVWNHNDGGTGHDNWASVGNDTIYLPAPLELRLKNNSGGSRTYHNFYLCVQGWAGYSMIEGEDALSGATAEASSGASGPSAQVGRVTGGVGTQASHYQLTGATGARAGMNFHLLARCAQISKSCFVRAELWSDTGSVILDRSAEVWLAGGDHEHIQYFGTIQLPARGAAWGNLRLVLNWRFLESTTVDVDFINLHLAAPGHFRHLRQMGMAASNNWEVIDYSDGGGRNGAPLTKLTDGTTDYPVFDVNDQPLYISASTDVIHILHDGVGMTPNWTISARAWYRPRRLTV